MYKVVQELADGLPEQWAERAVEAMRELRERAEGPVRVPDFDALRRVVLTQRFASLCDEMEVRPRFRDRRVEFVSDRVPGTVFSLSLRDDGSQSCETCAFRVVDVVCGEPHAVCVVDRCGAETLPMARVCGRYARQSGV